MRFDKQPEWAQSTVLALLFGALYGGAWLLSRNLPTWTQGVPVFLPAGVRLIALLVAGRWGMAGVGVSAVTLAGTDATVDNLGVGLGSAVMWVAAPWLAYHWLARWHDLRHDLSDLRFGHLVSLSLVTAVAAGLAVAACTNWWQIEPVEPFWPEAVGLALGDFLGTGAVLVGVLVLAQVLRWSGRH